MNALIPNTEATQKLSFYQKGTFTVGNRLVSEAERSVQASIDRSNALTCGHRACQGCGEALGARYAIDAAMRASGGQLIAVNATGCLEVFTTPYPETSWQVAWLHSLFGNAAAVATGVAAAMRVKGHDTVRTIAQGGDGGTTDIGFGCLSGMFERNDDVLYICYDNEAYMNTGVQRSSAPRRRRAPPRPRARRRTGQRVRHRQERAEDRHRARHSLRGNRDSRRPPRPRTQGRQGDGHSWSALHSTCTSVSARLGLGIARYHSPRPARGRVRLFPVFEASTASSPRVARSATMCRSVIPQAAETLRPSVRVGRGRVRIAKLQAIARSQYRRVSPGRSGRRHLMEHPFAITLDVGTSLANHTGSWRTERPSMSTGCRPATTPVRRREHPGLAVPRRGGRLRRRVARSHAGQSDAGDHGSSLLSPVRDACNRARSTKPSASTRSSAFSAMRRSSKAGSSRHRPRIAASACSSLAPGRRPVGRLSPARLGHAVEIYEAGRWRAG
jgi:hypothetical protein